MAVLCDKSRAATMYAIADQVVLFSTLSIDNMHTLQILLTSLAKQTRESEDYVFF